MTTILTFYYPRHYNLSPCKRWADKALQRQTGPAAIIIRHLNNFPLTQRRCRSGGGNSSSSDAIIATVVVVVIFRAAFITWLSCGQSRTQENGKATLLYPANRQKWWWLMPAGLAHIRALVVAHIIKSNGIALRWWAARNCYSVEVMSRRCSCHSATATPPAVKWRPQSTDAHPVKHIVVWWYGSELVRRRQNGVTLTIVCHRLSVLNSILFLHLINECLHMCVCTCIRVIYLQN